MTIYNEWARLAPEKADTLTALPAHYISKACSEVYMSQEKKFYVYVHRYATGPKAGQVFYVGKGSGDRWVYEGDQRNTHWKRIVKKYGFVSESVFFNISEVCAFSLEKAVIKHYGRSNLCNMTDGGEGVSGLRHTDETKLKLSGPRPNANIFLRGKQIPDWWKAKLRVAKLGKKQSLEHAAKSRVAKIGKKIDDTSKFNLDKKKKIINCRGRVFSGVNEAARILSKELDRNVSQGNISMVLTGRRKTAYGLKWRYYYDPST